MNNLLARKCQPTSARTPKLDAGQLALLLPEVPGWHVEGSELRRTFTFKDFREAMAFLNRVADVAEEESHHPDFTVHYRVVEMSLWTHVISGLSENDFIMAAKISELASA